MAGALKNWSCHGCSSLSEAFGPLARGVHLGLSSKSTSLPSGAKKECKYVVHAVIEFNSTRKRTSCSASQWQVL
eukprot:2846229-Amphidinium_carterae.1